MCDQCILFLSLNRQFFWQRDANYCGYACASSGVATVLHAGRHLGNQKAHVCLHVVQAAHNWLTASYSYINNCTLSAPMACYQCN